MGKSNSHKPPIAIWKPKKGSELVESDGKLFICNFHKVIRNPGVEPFSKFMINKTSYEKQLDHITKYVDYFMQEYDHENELMTAYLRIKYNIDKEKLFALSDDMSEQKRLEIIEAFIDFVHSELFSEDSHIAENISKLAEDNYLDDVEKNDGRKKGNDKEYLESLEFTNEHIKILMKISVAMKIMSQIIFHYFYINLVKLDKESDLIYRFFKPLFTLFGEKVNMFNKLYVYVKSRVLESYSINTAVFEKRGIMGVDIFGIINLFVKKVIISENMVKFSFPENWDEKLQKYKENIPGFIKTIIKFQTNYLIKEVYEKNLTEVTNLKNSEGLSGQDKMEMNIKKMDEGKALIAKANADMTCYTIRNIFDIPVTMEEIIYMEDHWKPNQLQIRLINTFWANYFGNYRDTNLVSRHNFHYLSILLKKKLLLENGWEVGENEVLESAVLPYILTGNLEGRMNSRIIRNNKYMSKLEDDDHYARLCNEEYSLLLEIHPDEIKSIISTFVNSRFTYVTPEEPELLGTEIEYSEDKIGSEITFFLFNQ